MELFGIRLVGVSAESGHKLLLTLAVIVFVYLFRKLFRKILDLLTPDTNQGDRFEFWMKQGIQLVSAAILIIALLSIWFDNPAQLTSALGFVAAGLAVALQRVVTSVAAYFILLRGKNFNVGDRIVMGGVRGDVIDLDFIQTTVMEMGQAPGEHADDPSIWVHGRQYTGRIVTITNDKIFDTPVYNYTREFPYIWEELMLPIEYKANRNEAERILLDVANRHTIAITDIAEKDMKELERRYFMKRDDMHPRVFWQLTDNWLQMTVRFLARETGIRILKDKMSREIIAALDAAGIEIASGTYSIVDFPPVRVELQPPPPAGESR